MKHLLHAHAWAALAGRCRRRGTQWLAAALLGAFALPAQAALNGTYTINASLAASSTNYRSFAAAVSDLISGTRSDGGTPNGTGVTGPVVFNVASGTYVENLVFSAITGASPTNRIVFQSATGNRNDVWLGDNTANRAVVAFNQASYITFQNMNVRKQSDGLNGSRSFELTASGTATSQKCIDIRIINCYMRTTWTPTNTGYAVMCTGSNDSLKIKRCHVTNSGGVLWLQGDKTSFMQGLELDSNLVDCSWSAVWWGLGQLTNVKAPRIRYNDVLNNCFGGGGTTGPGILDIAEVSGAMEIAYNKSQQSDATYSYYIRNVNLNGETTPVVIYNNFIHHTGSNSQAAIYLTNVNYVNVYHNNVNGAGSNTSGLRISNNSSNSNVRIANNHFYSAGTVAVDIVNNTSSIAVFNANNYWNNAAGDIVRVMGTPYSNLATLKGKVYTNSDANSFNLNPVYTLSTPYDLRIGVTCITGLNLGITNDFFLNSRVGLYAIGAHQPTQGTDDIGVDEVVYPRFPMSAGTQDVLIRIRNFGSNSITSGNISYSLNGATPVTISLPSTLGSCDTLPILFSGITFTGGRNTFKVWTSSPNGGTDSKASNDTINYLVCTPLSGTYTVDATGSGPTNFLSMVEAVNQLACGGVSGPVTFNVAAGTYTGAISIPRVLGASAVNNIRFIGADSTTTIIQAAGTAAVRYTVRLDRAKYISFSGFTIRGTSTSYGVGVGFSAGADSNTIQNCIIENASFSNSNMFGVLMSADGNTTSGNSAFSHFNVIRNNIFNNAYYGVHIYSASLQAASRGNRIEKNTFNNIWYYGTYFWYVDNLTFTDNTVNLATNINNYGYYHYFFNTINLHRNKINNGGYAGIFLYRGTSGTTETVSNNMIVMTGNNANSGGFYLQCYSMNFYHNTVIHNGTTGSALRFGAFSYPTLNYALANNVFQANNGAYAAYIDFYRDPSITSWDWDNLYSATSNFIFWRNNETGATKTYSNLASLKLDYPTWHASSITQLTNFVSPTDAHLSLFQDAPRGLTIPGINIDVDGDARCAGSPSLGADESKYTDPNFTAGFLIPDTVYVGAPVNLFNKFASNPTVTNQWDQHNDGSVEATSANATFTFNNIGTDSIRLTSTSCVGSGSVVKYVTVLAPFQKPVAEFLAERYSITKGESIRFTNLSKNGATSFKWLVTPLASTTFIPSDSSFNTQIRFDGAGRFQVCLVAMNAFGADTICKSTYIDVKEEVAACIENLSRAEKGSLYDQNLNANYNKSASGGSKTRCLFLIDPCATSLSASFSQFTLAANNSGGTVGMDSVRIFNGSTTGSPVIGAWSQNNPPALGTIYNASSGKMLVEFLVVNNANTNAPGFKLDWTSTPGVFSTPIVTLEGMDTAYVDADYRVRAVTNRKDLLFDVEMDNDPFYLEYEDEVDSTFYYTYYTPGTYEIKVIAKGCGGPVEVKKTIIVLDAFQAPRVDFEADNVNIYPNDVVSFRDKTNDGPIDWQWEITPATHIYEPGYNNTSQDPKVKFLAPGKYTVKLWARNWNTPPDDTASLVKVDYINVIDYCAPAVGALNTDLGISRVQLGTLNNVSAQGVTAYTYYNSLTVPELNPGYNFTIRIDRNTTLNKMNRKAWIDYNGNGVFESTELIAFEASAQTLSYTETFYVPKTAVAGQTRMRVGTSFGSDPNAPCGINAFGEFEDYNVMIKFIPDMVKPQIALFGTDTTIEVGSVYADAGASAFDTYDGDITGSLLVNSNVDPNVLGTYTVVYKVLDAAGNAADSVVRVVTVVDTQLPVITLNGANPDSVPVFGTWNDPGATVADNYYTGLTASSNSIATNVVGEFDVIYNVTDGSGNAATPVVRKVKVYDAIAPVITVLGPDTILVDVKSAGYNDPGVTITDNYYSGLSATITGTPNFNVLGDYTIIYNVTDGSGNAAAAKTRVIRVVDRVAPVMTLNGPSYLNIQWAAPYTDAGVTISDNYYAATSLSPVVTNGVDVNTVGGPYFVTYELTDPSGNKASSVTRTVYVVAYQSVKEEAGADGINLFPNPTTGEVKIQFTKSDAVQLSVYNSLGQLIQVNTTQESDLVYTVDLQGLAAGAYLVRIQQGDTVVNKTVNLVR